MPGLQSRRCSGTTLEVCITPDADLGQVHDSDIAAMAIHDIPPALSHFEDDAPLLLPDSHGLSGMFFS